MEHDGEPTGGIRETVQCSTADADESSPLLPEPESDTETKAVRAKVPQVEVHLFRRGEGPIDIFKSNLGGWEQDQLQVGDILDNYNLKSVFAFVPASGRGLPIRFDPRNGRSLLPYTSGSVIFIDGEPKDSFVKPITRIFIGVAAITAMIVLVTKEMPEWMKRSNFSGARIPPWVLICMVIFFTRMRSRTRDILRNLGW